MNRSKLLCTLLIQLLDIHHLLELALAKNHPSPLHLHHPIIISLSSLMQNLMFILFPMLFIPNPMFS